MRAGALLVAEQADRRFRASDRWKLVPQGRIELPTSPFIPLRLSPPRAMRVRGLDYPFARFSCGKGRAPPV